MFFQYTTTADTFAIDEQTASDMLLEEYADTLAEGTSIFGRQVLYKRLREGYQEDPAVDLQQDLNALSSNPALPQIIEDCLPLRQAEREISGPLFAGQVPLEPKWSRLLWLAPLALISTVILALLLPAYVPIWGAVILAWGGLLFLQMHFYTQAAEWEQKMRALRLMLHSFTLLDQHHQLDVSPAAMRVVATINRQQVQRIIRGSHRSPFLLVSGVREYADWVMLDNIKYYFKTSTLVRENLECLQQLYLFIANLDADLALVRHLQKVPQYCWAQPVAANQLHFQQVVHPLLGQAQALSIDLMGKGAFISGQNGIGKSTLLRTIGLNLIVARAFGFCYAAAASVPRLTVYASMQNEDSLLGGESLYLAELRRAKELLHAAENQHPALFIIDEIFRGTNHLESISAAAAVLHDLSKSKLVIVSSHNLVLASLLEQQLSPLCVVAETKGETCLRLQKGVLNDTNGISLLVTQGFGVEIEGKARRVFDWLNLYLAHPENCGQILGR